MWQAIDLTGHRFGRLVVLGKDPVNYKRTTLHPYGIKVKTNLTRWIVKCDCGAVKSVLGINLKRGRTQSCGCLRKEDAAQRGKERRQARDGSGKFISTGSTRT